MWFCCFWVTARVKEFDCSSLSQWQIPSRLLDSELHRFFLTARSSRKCCSIHFLSLSAVSITIAASMIVLEESQTLHQVATGSIAGKFATFSLNFSLNPRLCSAVQLSQHTSVLHPGKSNQFHSKLVRGRSASSSNPSFGGSNISTLDQLQRVRIPAVLSLLYRLLLPISICPLFDNWFLLCEVPWVIEQQLEEFFI